MNVDEEIVFWNSRFPIDRWWRQKHKIPYNSKAHKEANFLDQLFEYKEDKLFEKLQIAESYVPNIGKFIKEPEFSNENERLEYLRRKSKQEFEDFDDELEE